MAVKKKRPKTSTRTSRDAISILKADHRQVAQWFSEFEKSKGVARKRSLANKICDALTGHMKVEEETFYPEFLKATGDKDTHHEAEVEHSGAKNLLSQIQKSSPSDDFFDSKVHVLSEMIKHHVKEEEQRGGMFAEAKRSDVDLQALGRKIAARKRELSP